MSNNINSIKKKYLYLLKKKKYNYLKIAFFLNLFQNNLNNLFVQSTKKTLFACFINLINLNLKLVNKKEHLFNNINK